MEISAQDSEDNVNSPRVTERSIDLGIEEDILELFDNNRNTGYYSDIEEPEPLPDFSYVPVSDIADALSLYLRYFDREEMDIVYLNFLARKTQVDLRRLMGKSQPAICNDRRRILREMELIRKIQSVHREIEDCLCEPSSGLTTMERSLLAALFYTFSVTKTAKVVGISPMNCRSKLEAALLRLRKLGHLAVEGYFQTILENLNGIRKEISPSFDTEEYSAREYSSGHRSREFVFDFPDGRSESTNQPRRGDAQKTP